VAGGMTGMAQRECNQLKNDGGGYTNTICGKSVA
jgi:hypothetical protein